MSVTLTVLVLGAVAGLATYALVLSPAGPDSTPPPRSRLAERLERFPKLAEFVARRLDRTSAGGLLLTVGILALVGIGAVVGAIFDMVDDEDGFASFDLSVAEYGANNPDSFTVQLADLMTHLGGTRIVIAITIVVAAWGWWRYKSFQVALFMITVAAGQAIINNGLKWMIDRDRPDIAQLAPWSGSSFPSGHSAAAAATYFGAAYVLTLRSRRSIKAVAFAAAAFIAIAVAATRAVLGVHWLTDVIAGFSVGFAWFLICVAIFGGQFMELGHAEREISEDLEKK